MSCDVGCRCGLDPAWLWLWHRPAATGPIRPPAWELSHAAGVAEEMAKRQKTKQKIRIELPNDPAFLILSIYLKKMKTLT